jgi:tRNA threonylcarbamoyladenosine modification (KEOPS) complex  Pcc1 subunit
VPTEEGRDDVTARAQLELRFPTPEEARVVWEAVSADDPGSVVGRVEDDRLVIETGPSTAASVRVTIDDLLACIQAATGGVVTNVVRGEEGDED